jgi:hypothetical protein
MPKGYPLKLTGKRFGSWLVLDKADAPQMWLCRCDCGNECTVLGSNLTRGMSTRCKDCGVRIAQEAARAAREALPPKPPKVPKPLGPVPMDMTGRRFGSWTVLYWVGVSPGRQILWKCRCDCGTERSVQGGNLRSGNSTQCRECGREAAKLKIKSKRGK